MTSTVPLASAGAVATMLPSARTMKSSAGTDPKLTPVAPVKWLPLMVVTTPPAVVPLVMLSPLTDGAVALVTVKWSPLETAEVPVSVSTVTSTVPLASGGATAVIRLSLLTKKSSAGTVPKKTPSAPVKPLPLMATTVPPAVVPVDVPRLVTDGAGTGT